MSPVTPMAQSSLSPSSESARPRANRFYGQILKISLPLVMSMATVSVTEFTDRVFLANYHLDAIAAALPAGICAFLGISFFMGITAYLNVFVAQYMGARTIRRVGSVIWQGIYIALFAAVCLGLLSWAGGPLFRLAGHAPGIQQNEIVYFRILCLGGGTQVMAAALASFFTGRGITLPVLLSHIAGMLLNIPLNYGLIFGVWGLPELGMAGAALGTVISWTFIMFLLAGLVFRPQYRVRFGLRAWGWDAELTRRIFYFGIPGSFQFSLDVIGFTFFALMVGRLGRLELAVTNMVLSINSLAFLPALGFSQGISTLVGNAMGAGQPQRVQFITRQTIYLFLGYLAFLSACFWLFPETLLSVFTMGMQELRDLPVILTQGRYLLRLVSVYLFFDALYMIFVGVLKGAGDTRFIMISIGMLSVSVMIVPIWVGIEIFAAGLFYAWGCVTVFIISLFGVTWWRYRQGRWATLRVIREGR